MNTQSAYPLSWPTHRPRAKSRVDSPFGNHSMEGGTQELRRQLKILGAHRFVLSTNVELRLDGLPRSDRRSPVDPGVAVYFQLQGKPVVMACDKWRSVEDNLWAITKHIEAIRGTQRWGVGELAQAFAGYTALPPPADMRPWWAVLGVTEGCTYKQAYEAYKSAIRKAHPDTGGSNQEAAIVNGAWDAAQRALKF